MTHAAPANPADLDQRARSVHGVRRGDTAIVAGQTDRAPGGRVRNPGDLPAQIRGAAGRVTEVLAELGLVPADLVKVLVIYAGDATRDETALLGDVVRALGPGVRVAATAIPRAAMSDPAGLIEIEAVALRAEDDSPLPRRDVIIPGLPPLPEGVVHGIRASDLIYTSGMTAALPDSGVAHEGDVVQQSVLVMDRLGQILTGLGAEFDDVVKQNRWASHTPTHEVWYPAARACADRYAEPGPVATGIGVPMDLAQGRLIKVELVAMRAADGSRMPRRHSWPEGHWDWPYHLPYKHALRCGSRVFFGGQVSLAPDASVVDPWDIAAQAATTMRNIASILGDVGASLKDVIQVVDFYAQEPPLAESLANWRTCAGAFAAPGPAITMIPAAFPSYPGMMTEIEGTGIVL